MHQARTKQKWIYEKLKFKEFYNPNSPTYKKLFDLIFKLWEDTYKDEIQLNQQKIQKKKNMHNYVPELPEMVHFPFILSKNTFNDKHYQKRFYTS